MTFKHILTVYLLDDFDRLTLKLKSPPFHVQGAQASLFFFFHSMNEFDKADL